MLNAKRECLPQELQNRGIFPDIDSIIQNKDVPTIRLWIAYMLEKFRSRRLFGWRMVDFLREAGMIISIIEPIPKSKENVVSLSQAEIFVNYQFVMLFILIQGSSILTLAFVKLPI